MTDRYDAIVIGAGHNGLTCAAYLAHSGRRVLVVEAAAQPGGGAVTREFAPGYSVSACAHLLYLLQPDVIRELDLERHGLRLAAPALKTVALASEGEPLVIDGDRLAGGDAGPADVAAWPPFRARMQRFAALLGTLFARRPPRLAGGRLADRLSLLGLGWKIRRLGRNEMRELLRIIAINIYDVLEEQFDSRLLKGAVAFDAVLGTHLGPRSPNSVLSYLYRLTGAVDGERGALALPAGGMGNISAALAKAAEAHGVEIRTASPVARVLIERGRATGVELAGGEQLRADCIVSNADPKRTFFELVGAANLEAGFVRRVHQLRMRGNAAKLHLALDGPPRFRGIDEALAGERLLIAPDMAYVERAFDHAKYGEYSAAPAFELSLPSVRDPALAPPGGCVLSAIVQYAPYALKAGWQQERQRFQQRLIDELESYAPGLRRQIVTAELLSPADIEREFRMTGGHWHHGELTLDQFLMLRPVPGAAQYATPLPGLYLCGAGSHPGGGVMAAAGRNAAREIISAARAAA